MPQYEAISIDIVLVVEVNQTSPLVLIASPTREPFVRWMLVPPPYRLCPFAVPPALIRVNVAEISVPLPGQQLWYHYKRKLHTYSCTVLPYIRYRNFG